MRAKRPNVQTSKWEIVMGKRIERAGGEIVKILEQAIEKWHEELVAEKIIVAVLMVHPELDDDGLPKGPALKQNGLPVAGLAKIATPRERVLAGRTAPLRSRLGKKDGRGSEWSRNVSTAFLRRLLLLDRWPLSGGHLNTAGGLLGFGVQLRQILVDLAADHRAHHFRDALERRQCRALAQSQYELVGALGQAGGVVAYHIVEFVCHVDHQATLTSFARDLGDARGAADDGEDTADGQRDGLLRVGVFEDEEETRRDAAGGRGLIRHFRLQSWEPRRPVYRKLRRRVPGRWTVGANLWAL